MGSVLHLVGHPAQYSLDGVLLPACEKWFELMGREAVAGGSGDELLPQFLGGRTLAATSGPVLGSGTGTA